MTALPTGTSVKHAHKAIFARSEVLAILSISAFVSIWYLLSAFVIDPLLLPPPSKVLDETLKMLYSGELLTHVWASAQRILWGFLTGCIAGIPLGLLIGRLQVARDLILPILNLIRPISPVALVPLVIVWFGIGESAKIILVSYTTFIIIVFNAMAGAASTPVNRERAARCFGANQYELFRYVFLPSAVPYILTGMRIGLGFCYMSVVAAELVAADSGIGSPYYAITIFHVDRTHVRRLGHAGYSWMVQ